MRKIIVHEFITLDGVIQAPGGKNEDTEGGFKHGGWTLPYWHDDIGNAFGEIFESADTLLLGRKTWEIHGNAFEKMEGDQFADAMNIMPKIVVSDTLTQTNVWRNSMIINRNVVSEINKLKTQKGKNILIDGSSQLLHTLIENELVDEFNLHVYPLVLGTGKKLFPENTFVHLQLVETRSLPTGVVFFKYTLNREDGE